MQRVKALVNLKSSGQADDSLADLRAQIFYILAIGGLALGAASLVFSSGIAWSVGMPLVSAIFVLAYLALLFFAVSPRLAMHTRIVGGLTCVYLIGVAVLISELPYNIGPIWLFAFAVLTGILLGIRASLLAIALNAFALGVVGWWTGYRIAPVPAGLPPQVFWFAANFTAIVITLVITFSLSLLLRRLEIALQHQHLLADRLRAEIAERTDAEAAVTATKDALADRNRQLALLLETGNKLRWNQDVASLLEQIAGNHEELGYRSVIVNLIDPESGSVRVVVTKGLNEEGRALLDGAVYTWDEFDRPMQERFRIGECYFIPEGQYAWDTDFDGPSYVPPAAADTVAWPEEDRWHLEDILLLPLRRLTGEIIGILSFDQPLNGRRPSAETLLTLEIFANQAAAAFENAELYERLRSQVEMHTRAEDALRKLNKELDEASRLKDEFLANMSHELRTPLSAILGIAEAWREGVYGEIGERQQRSLKLVEASGRQLLALINDILDLAKADAGKMVLSKEPMLLIDLCQSSVHLIQPMATAKHLQIQLQVDQPHATLWADPKRGRQILTNLLSNAVKFTPETGQVGLNVTTDPEKQCVRFLVWDTGIGIDESQLERLFAPFVQLDSRLSRNYEGTGLGLALVSRLVRLHGGDVEIKSRLGEGTQVTVTFPWTRGVDASPSNQGLPAGRSV